MLNHWLFWALASAFFAGLTAMLAKLGVEKIDANLATAIRTTVILVLSWGIVWALSPSLNLGGIGWRSYALLGLSGVATGLSWICYFHALSLGPVSKVAPIDKLSVPLTLLLAFLFLGETLSWKEAAGAALIVAGALVMVWK